MNAELQEARAALATAQKITAMRASAFATIPMRGAAIGIDNVFSTGINYAPALNTALSLQNAAQAGLFGASALNNFNSTLDNAYSSVPLGGYNPSGGNSSNSSTNAYADMSSVTPGGYNRYGGSSLIHQLTHTQI